MFLSQGNSIINRDYGDSNMPIVFRCPPRADGGVAQGKQGVCRRRWPFSSSSATTPTTWSGSISHLTNVWDQGQATLSPLVVWVILALRGCRHSPLPSIISNTGV